MAAHPLAQRARSNVPRSHRARAGTSKPWGRPKVPGHGPSERLQLRHLRRQRPARRGSSPRARCLPGKAITNGRGSAPWLRLRHGRAARV